MFKSLRFGYDRVQDRALLNLTGEGDRDYRLWVTRRLVRELWPILIKALPVASRSRGQAAGPWGHEVLAFEREIALQRARSSPPRAEQRPGSPARASAPQPEASAEPDGSGEAKEIGADDAPTPGRPLDLLAKEVRVELAPDNSIKLRIFTADRRAVTMGFDLDNLHLFCEVLRKGTDRAGWDLDLKLPWETPATAMPAARA